MQSQMPKGDTNAQAFLLPFLQNTIGAGLMGYGKSNAADTMYTDVSQSPYGQFLPQADPYKLATDAGSIENLLGNDTPIDPAKYGHDYGSAERPDGLTSKMMQSDLMFAAQAKQTADDEAQKKQEILGSLKKSVIEGLLKNSDINGKQALDYAATGEIPDNIGNSGGTRSEKLQNAIATGDISGITDPTDLLKAQSLIDKKAKAGEKTDTVKNAVASINKMRSEIDDLPDTKLGRIIDAHNPFSTTPTKNYDQDVGLLLDGVNKLVGGRVTEQSLKLFGAGLVRHPEDTKDDLNNRLDRAERWLTGVVSGNPDDSILSGSTKKASVPDGAQATGETFKGKPVYILNGVKGIIE